MTTTVVMTTQSLAAVKARFSQVIDEVTGTHERVVVTRNGSPVAVVLAVEDYETLMETLEILYDPTAVAGIRDAQTRMDTGETFGEDDVRATVAARQEWARPSATPSSSAAARRAIEHDHRTWVPASAGRAVRDITRASAASETVPVRPPAPPPARGRPRRRRPR
jgi:prevent-host-death family protein